MKTEQATNHFLAIAESSAAETIAIFSHDAGITPRAESIIRKAAENAAEHRWDWAETFEPDWGDLNAGFLGLTDREVKMADAGYDNAADAFSNAEYWAAVTKAPAHETRHILGETDGASSAAAAMG